VTAKESLGVAETTINNACTDLVDLTTLDTTNHPMTPTHGALPTLATGHNIASANRKPLETSSDHAIHSVGGKYTTIPW